MATGKALYSSWQTIDEEFWNSYPVLPPGLSEVEVIRIRPEDVEYESVTKLRYDALAESGFVDRATMPVDCMRLERDSDSLILGCCQDGVLVGTATLNTITERYPALAMELEKGVIIDHPHYRSPDALEFAKLAIDGKSRVGLKSVLHFLVIPIFIARVLGKEHFWQVSRDIPEDIRWRERLGFDYSDRYSFIDASLNDMSSRIGYMHFPSVAEKHGVLEIVKNAYRRVLSLEIDE